MKGNLWFIALLLILSLVLSSSYMVSAQPYKIRKLGATIETPPSRTPPAQKHGGKTNRL
ncbi:hypothetical protein N665_1116s0015 [Sinapis alba]|nr:hypothetical protein N665_1116s0015 [Sinapis alba]